MKRLTTATVMLAIAVSTQIAHAQQHSVSPAPVTLPSSESRVVHSELIDRDFRIYVAFPPGYPAAGEYPALYVTDANWSFAAVTQVTRIMWLGRLIPPFVIVGIGYPTDDVVEVTRLRAADLTPTRDTLYEGTLAAQLGLSRDAVQTGGAAHFLGFVRDELIPFVEATYAVRSGDNAFGGFSFGGLFAHYVLMTDAATFDRYIIGSPSFWWDGGAAFRIEEARARRGGELAARVFMSIGNLEGEDPPSGRVSDFHRMVEIVQTRAYPGLDLRTAVLPEERHFSAMAATMSRGMRAVFSTNALGDPSRGR